jgi:hypothetical protein
VFGCGRKELARGRVRRAESPYPVGQNPSDGTTALAILVCRRGMGKGVGQFCSREGVVANAARKTPRSRHRLILVGIRKAKFKLARNSVDWRVKIGIGSNRAEVEKFGAAKRLLRRLGSWIGSI